MWGTLLSDIILTGTVKLLRINQSINQSIKIITTYKSDQWCTTHLKTKIKPKDNVQKVKTTQRYKSSLKQ